MTKSKSGELKNRCDKSCTQLLKNVLSYRGHLHEESYKERDFSIIKGMKKFYYRHSVKKCTKYPFDSRAHLKSAPFMVPDLPSPQTLAHPLRNNTVWTKSRVNHGLTRPALVTPLIVLTSALSRSFRRTGLGKVPKTMVWGIGYVRLWLTRDIIWTGSFRTGWARFGGDRRSGTINSTLLTPSYLLALLNTLHPVRKMYQVGWYSRICSGTGIQL